MAKKHTLSKILSLLLVLSLVLGIALPIGLFILLPTLIAGLFGDGLHYMVRNLIEGAIRILIFIGFVWATSKEKDVKRTYMYHGAEHKTIACYEAGEELTPENVKKYKRFHPRCGTSFLFIVILLGIAISFLPIFNWDNLLLRFLTKLALLPIIVGVSYEAIRFAGMHDNVITKILSAPGLWVQRITTKEPSLEEIEVLVARIWIEQTRITVVQTNYTITLCKESLGY
mgnify:CR=1 FL=1